MRSGSEVGLKALAQAHKCDVRSELLSLPVTMDVVMGMELLWIWATYSSRVVIPLWWLWRRQRSTRPTRSKLSS